MKKFLPVAIIVAIIPFLLGFKRFYTEQEWISWGNKLLNQAYDPSTETDIQKWEISLTTDHFVRLRKTYQHGRQEYFSLRIRNFANLNYLPGSTTQDTLQLKAQADDIIYQTYEDPKGDLDSMVTVFDIPVKKLSAGQQDSLRQALTFLRDKDQ